MEGEKAKISTSNTLFQSNYDSAELVHVEGEDMSSEGPLGQAYNQGPDMVKNCKHNTIKYLISITADGRISFHMCRE